tara:strand:+ start:1135 stop:1761 length:627 start_codon:yes stop_codon:yes gene_type:complete
MIDLKDIPASWLGVLEDIQKVCPSAVLAGGALRDLYHGVEVKDLDIFIQAGDEAESWGLFEKLGGKRPKDFTEFGYGLQDLSDMDSDGGAYPRSMQEVILVENYVGENPTDIPVQLIFVNWNTARIHERFDIGICRVSTDGVKVFVSKEFKEDHHEKVLNIRRCENKWMLGSSIERIVRLREKYADFQIALEGLKFSNETIQVDNQEV